MFGNRGLRLFAAIFVSSAVVALLWPRATGYVSTYAVVNAPVVTVRAPLNGTIVTATPALASPVLRDEILFDLAASRESRAEISRLQASVLERSTRADALFTEERALMAVVDALESRARAETEIEIVFLTRKVEEIVAIRQLHEVQWDRARAAIDRLQLLSKRGAVTDVKLAEAEFTLAEAEALIAADDARIAAMKVEIAAIDSGLPSPAGTGRRDFAYDRMDDIRLALADVRTRRKSAAGARDAALAELAARRDELRGLARFRPLAATNGVIWTASRQAGASVTLGSDLFQVLDCERRFVEVIFTEKAFENIPAGTEATVRLRGSGHAFSARVVSRHAAGGGVAHSAVDAAIANVRDAGGVKVFLSMEPADVGDPAVAHAFCDVGRTAEVQIRHRHLDGMFDPVVTVIRRAFDAGRTLAADTGSH